MNQFSLDLARFAANRITANQLFTVGTGGDFPNLNAALEHLSLKWSAYNLNGYTVELRLLPGFIMEEQVIVRNLDLSWITITAEDATVTIDARR